MKQYFKYIYLSLIVVIFIILFLFPNMNQTLFIGLAALIFLFTSILTYTTRHDSIFRKKDHK